MTYSSYTIGSESNQSLESGLSQAPNTVVDSQQTNITSKHSTGGANFYDGNTGIETNSEFGTHQASEGAQIFSAKGSPKSFIDSPNDLVTFQGMPVQAKTLETMGVLKLNGQGRYDFVDQAPTPEQQEQQQATTDHHDSFSMSESENNEINAMIPKGIDHGALQAITSRGIDSMITGDLTHTITALSQTSGKTPAEAAQSVGKVVETFTNASNRYLENTVGMNQADIPEFYDWAKTHASGDLKAAVSKMISTNNFRDMGKLVGSWAAANPPSEQALKAAGYRTGKSTDGSLTVFIKGNEMSVKAAARAKLI